MHQDVEHPIDAPAAQLCDCRRCFAERQDRTEAQVTYLKGPDFAALPECPEHVHVAE